MGVLSPYGACMQCLETCLLVGLAHAELKAQDVELAKVQVSSHPAPQAAHILHMPLIKQRVSRVKLRSQTWAHDTCTRQRSAAHTHWQPAAGMSRCFGTCCLQHAESTLVQVGITWVVAAVTLGLPSLSPPIHVPNVMGLASIGSSEPVCRLHSS